jgi:hypothetical protein
MALNSWVIPVDGGFRYFISGIVYQGNSQPVFILDPEAGTIRLGDGQLGAQPPAGEGIVASYRQGSGSAGNLHTVPLNFQPFLIPLQEFAEDGEVPPDLSLIVAGLTTVNFQTGPALGGVLVFVPLPGSLWLLITGILTLYPGRKLAGRKA